MPHDDGSNDGGDGDGAAGFITLAAVQDDLLTAAMDLDRLQTLLDDSHGAMQRGFFDAWHVLRTLERDGPSADASVALALERLAPAMKSLQFHDLATQLLAHTQQRLRNGADSLAREAFAEDGEEAASSVDTPLRPNPVTQAAMDEGLVELF